jgi:drug/metabolite transporter (DMT)-like permease
VVVALDLEGHGFALAEIDDPGVLARPLEDGRTLTRKTLQEKRRVLVCAVLRPEQRKDGQLEVVRAPPVQDPDPVELLIGEAERAVKRFFRDGAQRLESNDRRGRCNDLGSLSREVRGYVVTLSVLASIWGASYLFIKVAVEEIEPTAMMCLRLLLAASVLVPMLAAVTGVRQAIADIRATGREGVVLGFINTAFPFTLIAWGEKHIDSGIAAIANASVPIFVALLAVRFNPSERVRGLRLVGVLMGLAGVGVLAGLHPEGGWWAIAGTLAVVLASFSYASANLWVQHHFSTTAPLVISAATTVAGAFILLPFALLQLPDEVPGWKALGSVAALGFGGTALASLILYHMLTTYGSSRTSLVTYLMPPLALFYGVVLLGEHVTANAVVGLFLILAGVALGSGVVRTARREPVPASPRP